VTINPGLMIGGRYRIVDTLGSGGFATTYLAQDLHIPGCPICVVKQLIPPSQEPNSLKLAKDLFDKEAKTLKKLGREHDQIPQLLAYFEENQEFYLVEEYIDGNDLSKELSLGVRWSETEAADFLAQILGVLDLVHKRNYIHRDIKPPNIIRRKSDRKLVLIDFGAVKEIYTQSVNSQGKNRVTVLIGTPGYMPSEQEEANPRFSSDIYAVGIIAIQALTGIEPQQFQRDYKGEIVWRDRAQVSNKLANVLDQMVRHNYLERYQSAAQVLQALSNTTRLPLPKLRKTLAFLGFSGLLVLVVTIGSVLWQKLKPESENFQLYENLEQGIKIKYPENWQKRDVPNAITQEVIIFVSPKQDKQDTFQEAVTISVEDFNGTLDESVKILKGEIKKSSRNANILETSETTLDSKPARQLIFTSQVDGNNVKTLQVWALKGTKAYIVTYTADVNDYDKFINAVEKMIESFKTN
jgi:serine/threonine-protein kinase